MTVVSMPINLTDKYCSVKPRAPFSSQYLDRGSSGMAEHRGQVGFVAHEHWELATMKIAFFILLMNVRTRLTTNN
jgi:hypothetical protein